MSPSAAAQPKSRNVTVQQLEEVLRERPQAAGLVTGGWHKKHTQKIHWHLVHLARTGRERHVFSLARLFEGNADTGQCPTKSDREDVSCQRDRGSRLAGIRVWMKNGAKNAVKRMTTTPENVPRIRARNR